MIMRRFCPKKIKNRREYMWLSQKEVAEKAGITREYLSYIETGKQIPRATTIARLAEVLRVKEGYFFVNQEHNNINP